MSLPDLIKTEPGELQGEGESFLGANDNDAILLAITPADFRLNASA